MSDMLEPKHSRMIARSARPAKARRASRPFALGTFEPRTPALCLLEAFGLGIGVKLSG